ncbi:MAG: spc97 spc98 family [Lasallia pustulata]|uniref:Spindle pole body component n=1 Tax=Lasallia pustulata TaxID=136370 RepID=A0A5M8PGS7_9LECA|nr:MAG: spc97 spc98 family [Lasallia pustulata]
MDDDEEDTGQAFAIPDLWKTSALAYYGQEGNSPLITGLEAFAFPDCFGGPSAHDHLSLYLPDLDSFHFEPVEFVETPESSSSAGSSVAEQVEAIESIDNEDIWSFPGDNRWQQVHGVYNTWEKFYDADFQEPRSAYISEAGPRALDAALVLQGRLDSRVSPEQSIGIVTRSDHLVAAILQLGLGRDSLLFKYDHEKQTFSHVLEHVRMSGCSLQAFQSLVADFVECGNTTRMLNTFVERSFKSRKSSPARIAFADAVSVIQSAIEMQLSIPMTSIQSVLQLQTLFYRPSLIVSCLRELIQGIEAVSTDEELLSKLYKVIQNLEYTHNWLRPVLLELLGRVSRPWLDFAGEWIGLGTNTSLPVTALTKSRSFVNVMKETRNSSIGTEAQAIEYSFDSHQMPDFITEDDAEVMYETGKSLRLLQAQLPEHPLVRGVTNSGLMAPSLDWHFSWQDVERVETLARDYEANVNNAIRDFTRYGADNRSDILSSGDPNIFAFETFGTSEEDIQAHVAASQGLFETPLSDVGVGKQSGMQGAMRDALDEEAGIDATTTFAPPLFLTPLLSFTPLLTTQARLINASCLRLFFKQHSLRSHFTLQRRYHLFGDGVFTSRLSHALFDPELHTAERRKGVARAGSLGLKLGFRDTWPPASSELRLALMGILTGSYRSSSPQGQGQHRRDTDDLPGDLSFAIREISEIELQRCLDPNSIYALDFLRLQYKPPAPLESVITPSSLDKYDTLFKLLLRVTRMLYVVNQLFHDARKCGSHRWANKNASSGPTVHRFRIDGHHFVSAVAGYFFDVVEETWRVFEDKLNEIETRLDDDHASGEVEGLHQLRDYHERVLDRIMFALFLRKRQEQVMGLLEEIFTVILTFARFSSRWALGEKKGPAEEVEITVLYAKFQKNVRVFINVCRGLSERRGVAGGKSKERQGGRGKEDMREDGGNTIGMLLLRLEMSGYYEQSAGA